MEPILLSRKDAAALLGLSLRSIDYLLARGQLVARKLGRRTLIPRSAVEKFALGTSARVLKGQGDNSPSANQTGGR